MAAASNPLLERQRANGSNHAIIQTDPMTNVVSLSAAARASTEFSVPWEGSSVNVRAQREHDGITVRYERVVLWGGSFRCADHGEMRLSLRPRELVELHPQCLQVAIANAVWARIGLPALGAGEGKVLAFPVPKGARRRRRA